MTQPIEEPKLPNHPSAPIIVTQHYSLARTQSDGNRSERHITGSFVRVAFVTSILLPLAVVPYILSRRRISGLQRRFEALESKLSAMERRLSVSTSEISNLKDEQMKMRGLLHEIMQGSDEMRHNATQHAVAQSQRNEAIQSQIRKLLDETQEIRAQAVILQALGTSLADVAAFMHEMELQMGLQSGNDTDKRGIHRLRLLALQMQNITQKESDKKD